MCHYRTLRSLWLALHTAVGALHYSLKKVPVRLIEPPATFPISTVVHGEKPALDKDNDCDIVHLCFLTIWTIKEMEDDFDF